LYMGSNSPDMWYEESVALIPNPYAPVPMFDTMTVRSQWNGVRMEYWKRDHSRVSFLSDRSGHYLYPPAVLPSAQGAYFVESTFPLSMKERTIKLSPPHTPWFLLELPPYEMVGNRLISQKDGLVYDVIDEGTYISRRARHDDLVWAPFSPGGTVAITRYTVELKPLLNITYDKVESADTGLDALVYSGLKNERCIGFFF